MQQKNWKKWKKTKFKRTEMECWKQTDEQTDRWRDRQARLIWKELDETSTWQLTKKVWLFSLTKQRGRGRQRPEAKNIPKQKKSIVWLYFKGIIFKLLGSISGNFCPMFGQNEQFLLHKVINNFFRNWPLKWVWVIWS